ncbi:MAG TPA: hypothetical protein VFM09_06695 [Marmoricola sp.]|nr:hypothetical protein [Marmoricola sp.]
MHPTNVRLTAWALVTGSLVAAAGYAAAFAANGNDDARFAGSSWVALYTVALLGDVLVVLGLPAVVHAQAGRAPVLTRIGYGGILVPLVVLNVGEGTVEGFVKPYLATHGGIPATDLPGLTAYEVPALLTMLVGMVCLGVAMLRARTLPRWIGVLFLVVPLLGAAGLQGAISLLPDYLLFLGLFAIGALQLREGHAPAPATAVA